MSRSRSSLFDLERKTRPRSMRARFEDDVDLVRGLGKPLPSRSLLTLEQELLGVRPRPRSVASRAFDRGMPLRARGWSDSRARPEPEPAPFVAFFSPGHFTVETYDENPPVEAVAPPEPAIEDAAVQQDVKAIREKAGSPAEPEPKPVPPPVPERPVEEPSALATPAPDAHSVFERMGKSLGFATTFDVGAFELDRRFRDFERELDSEPERASLRSHRHPRELDDADVIEALSEISALAPDQGHETGPEPPPEPEPEPEPTPIETASADDGAEPQVSADGTTGDEES